MVLSWTEEFGVTEELGVTADGGPACRISGTVTSRRKLAKALAFVTLEAPDGQLEVTLRTADDVLAVSKNVHVVMLATAEERAPGKYVCCKLLAVQASTAPRSQGKSGAPRALPVLKPCKWLLQGLPCPMGGACVRRHEFQTSKEHHQALTAQAGRQRFIDHGGDLGAGLQHSKRGSVFGEWLIGTFGVEYLRSGSGVIDVAGGKQLVSQYLAMTYGIACTVVDPRDAMPICPSNLLTFRRRGLVPPAYIMAEFDAAFVAANSALVAAASVVIGQHPDEATESIVDVAIALGKPFAVVPCCVFSKIFPRKLRDGTSVVNYDQFISYLCEKETAETATRIERDILPMKGRNLVLFAGQEQLHPAS